MPPTNCFSSNKSKTEHFVSFYDTSSIKSNLGPALPVAYLKSGHAAGNVKNRKISKDASLSKCIEALFPSNEYVDI